MKKIVIIIILLVIIVVGVNYILKNSENNKNVENDEQLKSNIAFIKNNTADSISVDNIMLKNFQIYDNNGYKLSFELEYDYKREPFILNVKLMAADDTVTIFPININFDNQVVKYLRFNIPRIDYKSIEIVLEK